jgi:maleylacetate reductase
VSKGIFNSWGTERVVFGSDAFNNVAQLSDEFGARRVFVILSETLSNNSTVKADLERHFKNKIVGWQIGMPQHMPRPAVLKVAETVQLLKADQLLCIGGGSIIDSAKMIQLCLSQNIQNTVEFEQYASSVDMNGTSFQPSIADQTIRTICVPTTLSGAEFTGRAGSVDPLTGHKQIYIHKNFAPQVVVLDPNMTLNTPLDLWFSSGIRAIDHAVESLCSPDCNPYAEGLAANGLKLLSKGLSDVKQDNENITARLNCQLGSWSAIGALQAGATMGASHGIGHALGGLGVPHGYTSCVMLAHVLRYNYSTNLHKQKLIAQLMNDPHQDAADAVSNLVKSLGLPTRLRDVGIKRNDLKLVAENAMKDKWIHTNPKKISSASDVMTILESAW